MNSMFWVTTKCNMRCRYCYEGQEKREEMMSIAIADKAIEYTMKRYKEFEMNDQLTIGFHGGEPLLQFELIKYIIERFKDYFKYANEKLNFSLTTNGILLSEEISEYICNNIQYLSISLDGTKKTHDTSRVFMNGEGTYDAVVAKFINILKKRPDIRVRTAFTTKTVANLYEDVKHLIDLGFRIIVPLPDLFSNDWETEHMEILYSEMKKIRELLEEVDRRIDIKVGIIDHSFEGRPKGPCSGGVTGIHIDPKGNIYPCIYTVGHEEFILGHVVTGIIKERVEKIYELSKVENEDCIGCGRYKYCNGTRCKIVNKI
ncbi:MAG TPA: radical SAM protein, partial [Clostridia bacterium]